MSRCNPRLGTRIVSQQHVAHLAIPDSLVCSRTMLTTGFDGKSRDLVTVARMRASNRLAKTWRNNVNRATGDEGHPRVWLIGDAMHAMQPNRFVGLYYRQATRCTDTTCHARGMGGNQAFHDCADALSHILALKGKADSGVQPSTQDISVACSQYERRVIDRAFQWVRKSGGTSVPVSPLTLSQAFCLRDLTNDWSR